MAEISEQDFKALKDQVLALSNQLNAARKRIQDLENFATDHIGLDWGEALVDINAPHPNISVNTIESGGGTIRQDVHGMRVVSSAGDTTAVYFVEDLNGGNPINTLPQAMLQGRITGPSDYGGILLYSESSADAVSLIQSYASSLTSHASITATDTTYAVRAGVAAYFRDGLNCRVEISGALQILTVISPPQITSNQNNYGPTDLYKASVLRLFSDASRDITGLDGAREGRVLHVLNVGSFDIVLKDESASSSAGNRLALNGDITLAPDNSALLWYDSTSSRWRCVARYT